MESATEAFIYQAKEGLIAVPESSLTETVETEDGCSRSLDIEKIKVNCGL